MSLRKSDFNRAKRTLDHVRKAIATMQKIAWPELSLRDYYNHNLACDKLADAEYYLTKWMDELTKEKKQ